MLKRKLLLVATLIGLGNTHTVLDLGTGTGFLAFDFHPHAGRIIGKKGNVLDAIQYLTTRVAVRPGEQRRHLFVDAEGYRARHEDQLSQMARRLAQRVAAEGKVITFDPMSARDRRVVHKALEDFPGVRTESSGEGSDRRVQIIPAKGATAPAPGDNTAS